MRALWLCSGFYDVVRPPETFLIKIFRFSTTSVSSELLGSETHSYINENRRTQRHKLSKLLLFSTPENNPTLYNKTVHAKTIVSGFVDNTFLSNILISVYSKSGDCEYARAIFGRMSQRNLITWSTTISVYARHGFYEEALMVFLKFRRNCSENPNNEFILATITRCCAQLGTVAGGEQLHGLVFKVGLDQHAYVGTSLIYLYSKIGNLEAARLVFGDLLVKDAVTWTTIIMGFVKSGRSEVALQFFNEMMRTDVVLDTYVVSSVLAACSSLEFLEGGKQIHAYILRMEAEMDVSVSNVLVDFYIKCGRVKTGRTIFDKMVIKNVISWTTMISGYMQSSFDWDAMKLFADMSKRGFKPDGYACSSVLTSCGSLEVLGQGRQVHAYSLKSNLDSDEFVKNSLIDMYSKCDALADARKFFYNTANIDVISYNALIEGYSRQERLHEAFVLFTEMRINSIPPSLLTFISLLGVSASLIALDLSKQLHALIINFGFSLNLFAGSALIDVYSKCLFVADARLVFQEMNEKDIVVWNAMLFGHIQTSENEEAFRLLSKLRMSGEKPNEYTFVALITASSNLASLTHGLQFHNQVTKMGLNFDPYVTNALVDMYAKCGSMEEARKMFDSASLRDVACWNSMITNYAQHGEAEEALNMFKEMIKRGIQPNYVSFVGVLSACSHVGLVEEGLGYFDSMSQLGIEPGTEHYACVVSLLGRAGKLHEAREFIDRMPREPEAIVWRSLLSACIKTGNVQMAEHAAEMAISIDPKDSGTYTLLSNIFASQGMWIDVKKVREKMDSNRVVKETGSSHVAGLK